MTLLHQDRALAMPDRHRAWLEREELLGTGTCVWNGLNPSTAGVERNDPTITREVGFTQRLGLRRMVKLNLFTGRATKPGNLWRLDDPVGPDADDALERALSLLRSEARSAAAGEAPDRFICAWGATPQGPPWFRTLHALRVERTLEQARAHGVKLWCLGTTASGGPRHPLYVHGDTRLVPFAPGRASA
jgi:hypothetical protein